MVTIQHKEETSMKGKNIDSVNSTTKQFTDIIGNLNNIEYYIESIAKECAYQKPHIENILEHVYRAMRYTAIATDIAEKGQNASFDEKYKNRG